VPKQSLSERTRLRLIPQPPFPAPEPVRLYGPDEAPHTFAVHEMTVRDAEGNVVKRLVAAPGGFREVEP
jgi:hypothetical protein